MDSASRKRFCAYLLSAAVSGVLKLLGVHKLASADRIAQIVWAKLMGINEVHLCAQRLEKRHTEQCGAWTERTQSNFAFFQTFDRFAMGELSKKKGDVAPEATSVATSDAVHKAAEASAEHASLEPAIAVEEVVRRQQAFSSLRDQDGQDGLIVAASLIQDQFQRSYGGMW